MRVDDQYKLLDSKLTELITDACRLERRDRDAENKRREEKQKMGILPRKRQKVSETVTISDGLPISTYLSVINSNGSLMLANNYQQMAGPSQIAALLPTCKFVKDNP